jgi:hypothetical protein
MDFSICLMNRSKFDVRHFQWKLSINFNFSPLLIRNSCLYVIMIGVLMYLTHIFCLNSVWETFTNLHFIVPVAISNHNKLKRTPLVNRCLSTYVWLHSHLLGLVRFFSFLIFFTQSIRLLGRGMSPSQGRYLHTGQHKHRINAHRHPSLKWDWNPRSQCFNGRRQSMP